MAAQYVIRLLFHLNLQNRERKQLILARTTALTSPRTLFKQLYYGSSKSDVPSVTFPCVQQQQLVMPAPPGTTGPRALLSKQLYSSSRTSDSPSVPSPFVES